LVDSGGQYMRGTTDVTRTIVLGPVSDEIKKAYTLTLKGMLALADARFLYGCTGFNLDILARGPLWEAGLDYRCGTGHGVGYLLNVHESPNGFRWKHILGQNDLCVMEPGMVTSDEPGVYVDGKYGIRIENEIVCVRDYENEYGTFLKFKMLTCAPIDLEAVDVSYLNEKDIERINNYHSWVYEQLSPYMCGEELEKLKRATVRI
ncbi:MAG: M24 family metallopeptidase, partial [Eubacterium sp.]|nr:M24 family metallopeptidase [Eubacterium sp.]